MSPWNRHPHWETSLPWIQFLAPNSFNASHRRITPFSSSDFGDADLLLASVILGVSELCARDDINRKVECTIQIVNCVISITEYTKALPDCERKVQLGSGVLATHLLAHSALARWTLAIGTKESKMSTSKTKSISAFFEPAKRLRVDAKANAALISRIEPDAGVAHVLKKTARDTQTVRNVSTTAKGSDGFELYPLPGFEPPPFRGVNQQQSVLQETEETVAMGQELKEVVPAQEKGPEMTKERQMRMELNKTIARAKRNLRTCEEHIAECQKLGRSFPDFEKLLVEQSWLEVVQDEFTKQYMNILHIFVQRESAGKLPVYPPLPLIFNAFNTCPFDKVKVVIIGQDPYHGPGQAMGLSFSVPKGTKIPSSLVNIFKEIRDDVGATVPSHGNLEKWAHQGVLLLNAVLTVREHHANSHAKKGWEAFTDAVIRAVSQKREGVVFLLWGNSAHDKTRLIDTTQHHILKAAHPSGLSAHRGFFNCRHFSKTNKILEKAGELPIDWQL